MQSIVCSVMNGLITMDLANDEQNQLAQKVTKFISNTRPKSLNIKKKKMLEILHWRFFKEEKWKTFEIGIISLPLHDD